MEPAYLDAARPARRTYTDRAHDAVRCRLLSMERAAQLIAAHDRATRKLNNYARRREAELQMAEAFMPGPWVDDRLEAFLWRMKTCRTCGMVGVMEDGRPVIAWKAKCDCLRLCPDEARQDQSRVIKQYLDAILAAEKGWLGGLQITKRGMEYAVDYLPTDLRIYKGVFTMPNVPQGELHAAKRSIFEEWAKFRASMPEIKGSLVIEEDPQSSNGMWNVHLNAIMLVDGYLKYGSQDEVDAGVHCVRQYWPWVVKLADKADMLEATRKTLERRGLDAGELTDDVVFVAAIKECVKYPVQAVSEKSMQDAAGGWVHGEYRDPAGEPCAPPFTEWSPDSQIEWWRAQQGFRRVRSYGLLYNIQRPELPDNLDDGTEWFAGIYYSHDTKTWEVSRPWLAPSHGGHLALLPLIPRGISPESSARDGPPKRTAEELELLALMLQHGAFEEYELRNPSIRAQRLADEASARHLADAHAWWDAVLGQWRQSHAEFVELFDHEPDSVIDPLTRHNLMEFYQ